MQKSIQKWLPELCVGIILLFFTYRELGTFPAAWADDSLFMIVARSLAEGRGYALPILESPWHFPYTLNIGPPLILPVALFIKLFGFSVSIARIPMTLFLMGTVTAFYFFTKHITNRITACWSTILLVTLSAFVNNGKPVLGEVPGLFFLLLGLLALLRIERQWKWTLWSGMFFGLALLTKITYGLILPALGIAWLVALRRKEWNTLKKITLVGCLTVLLYLPWRFVELNSQPGLLSDFLFLWGQSNQESAAPFSHLFSHPDTLTRLPFLAYGTFLLLGGIGLWNIRKNLHHVAGSTLATLIILFTIYFLSSFGWYRHLLPAHFLLLPFVPIGLETTLSLCSWKTQIKKPLIALILSGIILLQGWWQLDHRGASRSTEAEDVAHALQKGFTEEPMVIQQAEVFVQLPYNRHWFFLTNPKITERLPETVVQYSDTTRCLPVLLKLSEQSVQDWNDRITHVSGRYYLVELPDASCPTT